MKNYDAELARCADAEAKLKSRIDQLQAQIAAEEQTLNEMQVELARLAHLPEECRSREFPDCGDDPGPPIAVLEYPAYLEDTLAPPVEAGPPPVPHDVPGSGAKPNAPVYVAPMTTPPPPRAAALIYILRATERRAAELRGLVALTDPQAAELGSLDDAIRSLRKELTRLGVPLPAPAESVGVRAARDLDRRCQTGSVVTSTPDVAPASAGKCPLHVAVKCVKDIVSILCHNAFMDSGEWRRL